MPQVIKHSAQGGTAQKRRPGFRPVYLLVFAFMGFFAYNYLHKTREIQGLARQESALSLANQQTRESNAREQARIRSLSSPQYVENVARAELGYTMPGEVPVQSQPSFQRPPTVRAAPPHLITQVEPTWKQWLDVFTR